MQTIRRDNLTNNMVRKIYKHIHLRTSFLIFCLCVCESIVKFLPQHKPPTSFIDGSIVGTKTLPQPSTWKTTHNIQAPTIKERAQYCTLKNKCLAFRRKKRSLSQHNLVHSLKLMPMSYKILRVQSVYKKLCLLIFAQNRSFSPYNTCFYMRYDCRICARAIHSLGIIRNRLMLKLTAPPATTTHTQT